MEIIRQWKVNGLDLYLINRGKGRECVHTCYIPEVLEERAEQGLHTIYPVPDSIKDDYLPYHPEVWSPAT